MNNYRIIERRMYDNTVKYAIQIEDWNNNSLMQPFSSPRLLPNKWRDVYTYDKLEDAQNYKRMLETGLAPNEKIVG